jgi:enoyl-CoA hydratase/carnithine racemase
MLKRDAHGHALYLTLDRPEVRNALSEALLEALARALQDFERDPDLRVVVLLGSDCGAFSVGGDLKEVGSRLQAGQPAHSLEVATNAFDILGSMTKPAIAAVDGHCLGGGFELAMLCDMRLATSQSRFGLPEPRLGMLAEHGLDLLSRLIPLGEALAIQLSGLQITADRAHQIGLVQQLVADRAALLVASQEFAEAVAQCSPSAVRAIKQAVRGGQGMPLGKAREHSAPLRKAVHDSPEAAEGVQAFLERRPPAWS